MKNGDNMYPCWESYSLHVAQDKMTAVARFSAPPPGAKKMTAEDMLADLSAKNIKYGICTEDIYKFFETEPFGHEVLAAKGKPCGIGKAGSIEYMFPTERKAKPLHREDGSVDFHKLNTICPCEKGELLAKLVPARQGEKGYDIYGDELLAPLVKEERLRYGKNVSASEDRLAIYSEVNGHVTLVSGVVFVSDLLVLENVDVSTGDIEYDGSILVNGNVFSGYTVKATGDIEIKGVVEGTRVESGGNISIARGMNGMSKGVLLAKGHIVSKYLENADVSAGEYVSTEAILHSQVKAGTEIEVTGRRGFITGGKVMATNKIAVKTLGSSMGAATVVEVGVNPELKKRQANLLQKMQEIKQYISSIEPVIMAAVQKKKKGIAISDTQMKSVQQMAIARQNKKIELETIYGELDELESILEESKNPIIEVSGEVFPGTKVCILDVSMIVKSNIKFCRFFRDQGEVKMTALW